MPIARSKVTAQGQISIPAEIRKKLGVGAGSTLEWTEEGDRIVVTRGGRYDCKDLRNALFGGKTARYHSLDDLKAGIRRQMRRKHAID